MNRGIGVKLPTGEPAKGDSYLLLIGIDDYVYWQPLRGPVADVEAVEEVLCWREAEPGWMAGYSTEAHALVAALAKGAS